MKLLQIRPNNLKEFQGKKSLKKNLSIYIKSALNKNEALDHCLFYGPAGVGKTSLAFIIANELKQKIRVAYGPEIQEKSDVINLLYSINDKNILFVDEVHAINPKCFEIFYSAMEDFKINIEIGKEFNKKISTVSIPKFTLVCSTSKLGCLPTPFEERFGIVENLQEYSIHEIFHILKFSLKQTNIVDFFDESILLEISNRSKGIPRIAKRILSRYLDYYNETQKSSLDVLDDIGIYKHGLEKIDLQYMNLLATHKKIGIKTLSQLLNIDEKTIVEKIEPFLIKNSFVLKTLNGRQLTNKGEKIIDEIKI